MITTRSYGKDNKLEITSIEKISFLKNTVWIDCVNPTNEERRLITKKTGVNYADISDCLDQSEKPRLQRDQNYFFFIISVPIRKIKEGKTTTLSSPLGIFVSKRFLLTVHKLKIDSLDNFVKNEENLKIIFRLGKERIIYNLIMHILKDFSAIIEELEQNLEKIENKVIKVESDKLPHTILSFKKTLLYIRRALVNNREVINSIKESALVKNRELLYDLHIEFVQQVDMIELARERLTVMLEIYFSLVSNRLNEIMKSFTVIASLLFLPMLISGIYGMNFINLPLKEHSHGFWIMLIIMFFSMLIMLLFFKKKRWV